MKKITALVVIPAFLYVGGKSDRHVILTIKARGKNMIWNKLGSAQWTCYLLCFAAFRVLVMDILLSRVIYKIDIPITLTSVTTPFIAAFVLGFLVYHYLAIVNKIYKKRKPKNLLQYVLWGTFNIGIFFPSFFLLLIKFILGAPVDSSYIAETYSTLIPAGIVFSIVTFSYNKKEHNSLTRTDN